VSDVTYAIKVNGSYTLPTIYKSYGKAEKAIIKLMKQNTSAAAANYEIIRVS
jgi:hypothetical protein